MRNNTRFHSGEFNVENRDTTSWSYRACSAALLVSSEARHDSRSRTRLSRSSSITVYQPYGTLYTPYQMVGKRGTQAERFWSKVDKNGPNGCWLWTGSCTPGGYGKFGLGRADEGLVYAHRWSWEQANGPIPEGAHIDHLCRVRNCVNPEHLEAVTPQENHERQTQTKHATEGTCPNGHPWAEYAYLDPRGHRRCRQCKRNRGRAYYAQNPERQKAATRRYLERKRSGLA
jgi:hypothetical protein